MTPHSSERAYARWIAFILVLFAITITVVVVWLLWFRPPRTVVHERPVVTGTATTPLHDSVREPKATKKGRAKGSSSPAPSSSRSGSGSRSGSRVTQSPTRPGVTQRTQSRSPARKRKTTRSPQKPSQGAQQPSTPPSEPSPQPGVTVPLPSVCLPPVKVGSCG